MILSFELDINRPLYILDRERERQRERKEPIKKKREDGDMVLAAKKLVFKRKVAILFKLGDFQFLQFEEHEV